MAPNLPSAVKSLLQPDIHKQHVISTSAAIQMPTHGSDEHLVRVHCVAPCASELTWAPFFPDQLAPNKTYVPCFEFSGTIILAPPESPFQPGHAVLGATDFSAAGHAREYTIARMAHLAHKPEAWSWEQAAAMPLSSLTAYQALFRHGGLHPPSADYAARRADSSTRLLITAASGGVGLWAVQLARLAGIENTIGVCGPKNVEFVQSLGATEVIDYTKQSLEQWAQESTNGKPDLVLDMVGGETLSHCWRAVKSSGKLISVVGPPEDCKPQDGQTNNVKSVWFIFEPNGEQLKQIIDLARTENLVDPVIDSVWEWPDFQKAFDRVDSGHARGKVVIRVS